MRDNTARHRFEIDVDGKIVFADYQQNGDVINIMHVETPVELRGQGAAALLMQEIATHAESNSLKINPVCSYAVAWMKRHQL